MAGADQLDRAVSRVVQTQNCSGCGACTLLDPGLEMRLDEQGFRRPVRVSSGPAEPSSRRVFDEICPGRRVRARSWTGSVRHPLLGPVVSAWEAWAADPELRHRGSSGGTLTALTSWLVDSGQLSGVRSAQMEPDAPRRTVPVTITSKADALAAAGSRYGPVAVLGPGALDPSGGVVAKPCEISAARGLIEDGTREAPLLLSFFCAGTPSQRATDELVEHLGVPAGAELTELWYRGRGWPGSFTAVTAAGERVSTGYDESWGQHLGRATQWRCKICPDGVGESADITAADYWRTDDRGYPVFAEGDGCSALIARTARGHEVLAQAFEAGVLVGRPLDPDALAGVQPLQTSRRRTLIGRLMGARLAGRPVPRYSGFGLARLAAPVWYETARTAKASYRRVRALGRPGTTSGGRTPR